jgi:hypothetical protein
MSKRTTIHLPADLLKCAKHKAAAEGRTLTSLIEEGMRLVLTKKRVTLPVSKATGGLLPGTTSPMGRRCKRWMISNTWNG